MRLERGDRDAHQRAGNARVRAEGHLLVALARHRWGWAQRWGGCGGGRSGVCWGRGARRYSCASRRGRDPCLSGRRRGRRSHSRRGAAHRSPGRCRGRLQLSRCGRLVRSSAGRQRRPWRLGRRRRGRRRAAAARQHHCNHRQWHQDHEAFHRHPHPPAMSVALPAYSPLYRRRCLDTSIVWQAAASVRRGPGALPGVQWRAGCTT